MPTFWVTRSRVADLWKFYYENKGRFVHFTPPVVYPETHFWTDDDGVRHLVTFDPMISYDYNGIDGLH